MTTNHTILSQNTSVMKIKTDNEPESLVDVFAGKVIAADDVTEAQFYFCKRTWGITQDQLENIKWDEEVKFKGNGSDTRSFEIDELLKDEDELLLDWLFHEPLEQAQLEEESDDNYYHQWLFDDLDDYVGARSAESDDNYDLQWLFE